jgi:hypothetical protein
MRLAASLALAIKGTEKDTGRSLRGGTIRSRQSRRAVVSPSFASSMALRVKAFASPSSSFSAATVALPRLPRGLSRLKRPPSRFWRVNSRLLNHDSHSLCAAQTSGRFTAARAAWCAPLRDKYVCKVKWRGATAGSKAFAPGRACFTGAAFGEEAKFEHATFGNAAYFNGASFGDVADFSRTKFGDGARFDGATFGDKTNFDDAVFGKRSFSTISANFDGAIFGDKARFVDAIFGEHAHFTGVAFGGHANFVRAAFSDDARFEGAVFGGAAFGDRRYFSPSSISPSFASATFCNEARFDGATFGGAADFSGAAFGAVASFCNTFFKAPVLDFKKTTTFNAKATFTGKSKEEWSKDFEERAKHADEKGKQAITALRKRLEDSWTRDDFGPDRFLSISFQGARFNRRVDFSARTFRNEADFEYARFCYPPVFETTTNLDQINFTGTYIGIGPAAGPLLDFSGLIWRS